ncbi:IS3 family transposase, partial [Treponema sp.]|uniref:IS3 family transposase n=1 Tax=Treponema sp. TaxID=166 RepID=UPI003F0592CD
MGNNQKYSIDLKLQVAGKYKHGSCGYKKLAREFNLSRDTVRGWCLNPRLQSAVQMAKKNKTDDGKDLEYYKTAAIFWEQYARTIEAELAKQGKKKLLLKAMKDCLTQNQDLKVRKLCKVTGVSKSSFYYNRNNDSQKAKDEEVLKYLKLLPEKILNRRGSKTKFKELKNRFNITVNHKRIERICRENRLPARNRLRKFPGNYYKQQKENRKSLPANILNRNFESKEPLKKFCTDVSYFKTKTGWLYLSPVLDLCGRKVQCYSISEHNDEALSKATLDKFFALGNLKGSILHTDQGPLYTSNRWRKRLKENGVIQSMSRKGNCWDNACMEHFFGTLKVESG